MSSKGARARSGSHKARERRPKPHRAGPDWSRWDWVFPCLVAAVLASPRLGLGYFWDDYYFLNLRGTGDLTLYLLPDPNLTFYRPIPQGLYMLFLRLVDPLSGHVGHWLNLALLVASIALFTRLAATLAGRWTGFLAGLCLATLGAVPSLVAWVSCSHDLFAMFFLLLALTLRHANRLIPSVIVTACALFSKESAAGFLPVLVLWDRLVGREPSKLTRPLAWFGGAALVWMAVHPGIRTLIEHRLLAGATGYVGLAHPERWVLYLVRYTFTLANIPVTLMATPWLPDLGQVAVAALVVVAIGFAVVRRSLPHPGEPARSLPVRSLVRISALLLIPPILLPALFVRHWAPYFAFGAALGSSLLLGIVLSKARGSVAFAVVGVFLMLGVWCRGILIPKEKVWSEPVLVDASAAIAQVKRNFLSLTPSMPKGAQLLLSVGATGARGITSTLIDGQALSLWYGDGTLHSAVPERRRRGYPVDLLYRVTDELHVILIDPIECRYVSTTRRVDSSEATRPVRTYARALAASGEPDLAIRIFLKLAENDQGEFRSLDYRLAASVARHAGRQQEADALRTKAGPLEREAALILLSRVFGNPTQDAQLDSCAYWAFEISPDDPEAIEYYLEIFRQLGNPSQIEHFAKRLDVLLPGNPRSQAAMRQISVP